MRRITFLFSVLLVLSFPVAQPAEESPLIRILAEELERNFQILSETADPKPYYISYQITDRDTHAVTASLGAIVASDSSRVRQLDVSVRVGSPDLDNYHRIRGNSGRFTAGVTIAIEDSPDAIKRVLWRETDRVYRLAAQRLINITTNTEVQVAEKEDSSDFSSEKPEQVFEPIQRLKFDAPRWETRLRTLSARFQKVPEILSSQVAVSAQNEWKYFVNTEGARLEHGRPFSRIVISAQSKAADGMDLSAYESFSAEQPEELPNDDSTGKAVDRVASDMAQLLKAPLVDPYVGPAILSGGAAGVFFHEIFGHRVEGHRLKDISDGQTFNSKIGEAVLPDFLSVTFDPTLHELGGEELNGWYDFDDEGVRGKKVEVVRNGTLQTFLMSRTPIPGVEQSNGHGRSQPGLEVVSRQSNLLVQASQTVSEERLREMLIEEIRRQGKPHGYYFQDITGGYTNTDRRGIQAFKVIPLVVYRVYADGRPDEMVRGADLVGTPLASFAKILAAGDKVSVFNGYCGAESGNVPVSASSPALLISEIEIQKQQSSTDRPPLLPPPTAGGTL